jgi:hypothetical protein
LSRIERSFRIFERGGIDVRAVDHRRVRPCRHQSAGFSRREGRRVRRRRQRPRADATFHDALRRARSLSEERLRRNPADAEAHHLVGAADCGNTGHDFWPAIRTDANRRAPIEYLKTL